MKSIHVGQLGLYSARNRMFMKMIHDRCSSSYANLWDTTVRPLICAGGGEEDVFFFLFFWSVTIRIYGACLDFIPWCKWCFRCNHAKAQLASISPHLEPVAPPHCWLLTTRTFLAPGSCLLSPSVCRCCLLQPLCLLSASCSYLLSLSCVTCHTSPPLFIPSSHTHTHTSLHCRHLQATLFILNGSTSLGASCGEPGLNSIREIVCPAEFTGGLRGW